MSLSCFYPLLAFQPADRAASVIIRDALYDNLINLYDAPKSGKRTAALQDATAFFGTWPLPQGFGVRLSSAAFISLITADKHQIVRRSGCSGPATRASLAAPGAGALPDPTASFRFTLRERAT